MLQRVRQISERDSQFEELIRSIFREEHVRLNNYNIKAQRGLSTAFTRSFFSNPRGNGSLITVQEISGGLLKRGLVDVVLDSQGVQQEIFTVSINKGRYCLCNKVTRHLEGRIIPLYGLKFLITIIEFQYSS